MKVLLDTNFLLVPIQFRVDVYSEFENAFTLDVCIEELKKLSKTYKYAKTALELAKSKNLKIMKTSSQKSTDRQILDYAIKYNTGVATNDKELIKSLKKHNIKIIRLRQKKYLVKV